MIRVRVSLQAVADLVQWTAVHLCRRHYVWAKINEQVLVDQNRRTLAQTLATEDT
jgi:hypothetical protein